MPSSRGRSLPFVAEEESAGWRALSPGSLASPAPGMGRCSPERGVERAAPADGPQPGFCRLAGWPRRATTSSDAPRSWTCGVSGPARVGGPARMIEAGIHAGRGQSKLEQGSRRAAGPSGTVKGPQLGVEPVQGARLDPRLCAVPGGRGPARRRRRQCPTLNQGEQDEPNEDDVEASGRFRAPGPPPGKVARTIETAPRSRPRRPRPGRATDSGRGAGQSQDHKRAGEQQQHQAHHQRRRMGGQPAAA